MNKKLVGYVVISIIFLSVLVPTSFSASDEAPWWNENWSFRKEINIPIDTSSEQAKYQPVDILIKFNNSCWVKDKIEHSIRIVLQEGGRFKVLESQIYDLENSDDTHINSCSLVFLIPPDVTGKEKYFVYYDDEEKAAPDYVDHVDVDESYCQYEPIPGISFNSEYYKITDEGNIVYAIAQKGKAKGDSISQQVTKLVQGSENVKPKNGEQAASFAFIYWWERNGNWYSKSTAEKLVSKELFVDGNLMVKVGIVSSSNDGALQSTVIYKYYYSPLEDKRIYVHAKHEIIYYNLEEGNEIDVCYAFINGGRIKSSTIDELNFDQIHPYLHFYYDILDKVVTYDIPYPESIKWQTLIGKNKNYDLSKNAWFSIDDGESGKAHALIFESNDVVKSGTDERNGIEIQLCEAKKIKLPGLEVSIVIAYAMRNCYEPGQELDNKIPADYVIEYNAEFFTTQDGGYKTVEKEASMYQSLIEYQPTNGNNVTDDDENVKKHSLTVFGHLDYSLFLKLLSSKLLIQNPYISAELYKDGELLVFGTLGRFKLTDDLKIDWTNISFFKKYQFRPFEPGKYVVKLWLENTLIGDKREFIGVQVIDLQSDTKTHILCKSEGKIGISVLDQDNDGIENAEIFLLKDGEVIVENISDSNGIVTIGAPSSISETYTLRVMYKGFLISEEEIRLGITTRLIPLKKTFNFDIYGFTLSLRGANDKIPAFDAEITLTSNDMISPETLKADIVDKGDYKFLNLYPGDYLINIRYNSFEVEESIHIPTVEKMDVNLYDFNLNIKDNWNLTPETSLDVMIITEDFGGVVVCGESVSTQDYVFSNLYPGNYTLKIVYRTHVLKELIKIPNGNGVNMSIIFPAVFNVTITAYDSHGNKLKNAEVVMMRGGINLTGIADDNGIVILAIPPGNYECKIYSNGNFVAEREINVLDEKSVSIVTADKPISNYVIIGLAFIIIAGALIIDRRKKDPLIFLKILAITIAIVAIISPWWALVGSSSDPKIETTTKMFISPTEMVTLTSANDVVAGELASLEETFQYAMSLLPLAISVAVLCIILSIILKKYNRNKLSFTAFLSGSSLFAISTAGFYYAMSEMANIIVGGFTGSGNIEISIPGRDKFESLACSWGPDIGFYIMLISTCILIFILFIYIKRFFNNKKKPAVK